MQSATNDGATLRVATTAHHVNAPIDSSITTPYTDVKRKSVPVQNPPDDLESCIREAFNAAVTLGRRAVEEAHLCGTLLIEAKLWTEHGEWLPLLARVGIAARTAQRFMRLADKFKCAELGAFASVEAAERALLPAPAPPAEPEPEIPYLHAGWREKHRREMVEKGLPELAWNPNAFRQWWLEYAPIRRMTLDEHVAALVEQRRVLAERKGEAWDEGAICEAEIDALQAIIDAPDKDLDHLFAEDVR